MVGLGMKLKIYLKVLWFEGREVIMFGLFLLFVVLSVAGFLRYPQLTATIIISIFLIGVVVSVVNWFIFIYHEYEKELKRENAKEKYNEKD